MVKIRLLIFKLIFPYFSEVKFLDPFWGWIQFKKALQVDPINCLLQQRCILNRILMSIYNLVVEAKYSFKNKQALSYKDLKFIKNQKDDKNHVQTEVLDISVINQTFFSMKINFEQIKRIEITNLNQYWSYCKDESKITFISITFCLR
ncbi:unnamed protein product [Paramecium sonneborni]|uniref:Uncharacterized protein n=1 Tax=Paramecium sonneborni TaxID=65129 RepID=A0A8S1RH51_9CILI|nr:unnamed protein product [Paramecium sonneborni]